MTELPLITQEDIDTLKAYIDESLDRVGDDGMSDWIAGEEKRLGFDMSMFVELASNGKVAGAIHFGLLLAELQRNRAILEGDLYGDVDDLKE